MRDKVRTKNIEMRVIKWERVWNNDKEEEKNRKSKREREARIILPMVKIGFMQVHPTFKTCFIYLFYISFNPMIRFILMNCHFDCYASRFILWNVFGDEMVKTIVLPLRYEIVMICNTIQVRLNGRWKMRCL